MYVLLSPAKKLHDTPVVSGPTTVSSLMEQTAALMETTRALTVEQVKATMHLSDKLAALNHARFQAIEMPFTDANATPAIGTFAGDTYIGFDAETLTADDVAFAQDRIGILSGLYGLLRPMDQIQPYRLEMGTRLATPRGSNLYAFWGTHIAAEIQARVAGGTVVNLASTEYFKSVGKHLDGPVITPTFKEVKPDGSMKTVSFVAKRARGMMARYVVDRRLEAVDDLKAFDRAHYRFSADLSTATHWVFTRPWQDKPLSGMPR